MCTHTHLLTCIEMRNWEPNEWETDIKIKIKKLLPYVVINLFMPFFLWTPYVAIKKRREIKLFFPSFTRHIQNIFFYIKGSARNFAIRWWWLLLLLWWYVVYYLSLFYLLTSFFISLSHSLLHWVTNICQFSHCVTNELETIFWI